VKVSRESGRNVLRVFGVKLADGGEPPVATEDLTPSVPSKGSQLVWKIVRRWQRDFTSTYSGSPGLFFSFKRGVVSDVLERCGGARGG
jgi:hypothetical protein